MKTGKVSIARSLRARSHNLFIDFLNVSVLSYTVVYSTIPYEKIKAYMFLRRSLVHISYMYMIFLNFLCRYIWGLAPPPPIQKSWLRYCCHAAFAHQKSSQMKMANSAPPPPLATRNRRHCRISWWYVWCCIYMAGNINGRYNKMVIQVSLTILAHLNFPSSLTPNCHGKATYFFVSVVLNRCRMRHVTGLGRLQFLLYCTRWKCIPRVSTSFGNQ